jgi:hypothetical protein
MSKASEPKIPVSLVEKIRHKLARLLRGDDYAWSQYHKHYAKEFAAASSNYAVGLGEFEVVDGRVVRPANARSLHPNVELFLKVLFEIAPESFLEIGPGWGHQLVMVRQVIGSDVFGIDISQKQLDSAIKLFPELSGKLEVGDVTKPLGRKADMVYANAVTMHVGTSRMEQALGNMVAAAGKAVFLVENWNAHDYAAYCKSAGLNFEWVDDFGVKGLLIRTGS